MSDSLPRLKPDPIPAIHPVPEYAASGRLVDVYARTKRGLGVPWMGVVTMAFAHYRNFYECLWRAFEPVAQSGAFNDACEALRQTAEHEAAGFAQRPLIDILLARGYTAQDLDEIRACNEIFSDGNMPYVLMATRARMLLEGMEWPGNQATVSASRPNQVQPKPILIEPHHADDTLSRIYDDVRSTLGLPFVNTDYRAFARWPSYFTRAWATLKPTVQSAAYEPAVFRVHNTAISLAGNLPNPTGLTPRQLSNAAEEDASLDEVLAVVRLFQWLLPGLAVNVAALREQIVVSEISNANRGVSQDIL